MSTLKEKLESGDSFFKFIELHHYIANINSMVALNGKEIKRTHGKHNDPNRVVQDF